VYVNEDRSLKTVSYVFVCTSFICLGSNVRRRNFVDCLNKKETRCDACNSQKQLCVHIVIEARLQSHCRRANARSTAYSERACVCVCVCVCERERERGGSERGGLRYPACKAWRHLWPVRLCNIFQRYLIKVGIFGDKS
jgi:hypothetical protein